MFDNNGLFWYNFIHPQEKAERLTEDETVGKSRVMVYQRRFVVMKQVFALLLTAVLLLTGVSTLAVEGADLAVQIVDKSALLQPISSQYCSFQCGYTNQDPDRTVAGFDLAYRALDRNRNISMGETTQYIALRIEPQAEKTSPVIYIANQSEIAYLIIAVLAVYFTDGTSEVIDFAAGEKYNSSVFKID